MEKRKIKSKKQKAKIKNSLKSVFGGKHKTAKAVGATSLVFVIVIVAGYVFWWHPLEKTWNTYLKNYETNIGDWRATIESWKAYAEYWENKATENQRFYFYGDTGSIANSYIYWGTDNTCTKYLGWTDISGGVSVPFDWTSDLYYFTAYASDFTITHHGEAWPAWIWLGGVE